MSALGCYLFSCRIELIDDLLYPTFCLTQSIFTHENRLGTPQNSETCSSLLMLTNVDDNLIDESKNKLKLGLLGHVNPTPLSYADLNSRLLTEDNIMRTTPESEEGSGYEYFGTNSTGVIESRQLYDKNKGGFFSSLSKSDPITEKGRAYGFVVDIDIELKLNDGEDPTANTALLGGYVLESSLLVYPVAMTQSRRDPNQIYVVSMHADQGSEGVLNPEYTATIQMESDASLRMRPDLTLGGAGGNGEDMVGGVPKYGDAFYVSESLFLIKHLASKWWHAFSCVFFPSNVSSQRFNSSV